MKKVVRAQNQREAAAHITNDIFFFSSQNGTFSIGGLSNAGDIILEKPLDFESSDNIFHLNVTATVRIKIILPWQFISWKLKFPLGHSTTTRFGRGKDTGKFKATTLATRMETVQPNISLHSLKYFTIIPATRETVCSATRET